VRRAEVALPGGDGHPRGQAVQGVWALLPLSLPGPSPCRRRRGDPGHLRRAPEQGDQGPNRGVPPPLGCLHGKLATTRCSGHTQLPQYVVVCKSANPTFCILNTPPKRSKTLSKMRVCNVCKFGRFKLKTLIPFTPIGLVSIQGAVCNPI